MKSDLKCVARVVPIAVVVTMIPFLSPVRAQDPLTNDVSMDLNNQWATVQGTETAIRALEAYGSKKDGAAALKILESDQPLPVKLRYKTAFESMKESFWRLVAGSHTPFASCDAATPQIVAQYGIDIRSLAATSKAYREENEYTALAKLLKAAPNPPPGSRLASQNIYRGCFSISPQALFHAVDVAIAVKP
jgi:hypothetical protein